LSENGLNCQETPSNTRLLSLFTLKIIHFEALFPSASQAARVDSKRRREERMQTLTSM
jgi:hypothetical protein